MVHCHSLLLCCSTDTPHTPSCFLILSTLLHHPLQLAPCWAPGPPDSQWNDVSPGSNLERSPEVEEQTVKRHGSASFGTALPGWWKLGAAGLESVSGSWSWPPAGRCASGRPIPDGIWPAVCWGICFHICIWSGAPLWSAREVKQTNKKPNRII